MRELGFAAPSEIVVFVVVVGAVVGAIWTAVQARQARKPWHVWAVLAVIVPPVGGLVSPVGHDYPLLWIGYALLVSVVVPLLYVAVTR